MIKKKTEIVDNKEISNDIFQGKENELWLYKYHNKNKFKDNSDSKKTSDNDQID